MLPIYLDKFTWRAVDKQYSRSIKIRSVTCMKVPNMTIKMQLGELLSLPVLLLFRACLNGNFWNEASQWLAHYIPDRSNPLLMTSKIT